MTSHQTHDRKTLDSQVSQEYSQIRSMNTVIMPPLHDLINHSSTPKEAQECYEYNQIGSMNTVMPPDSSPPTFK